MRKTIEFLETEKRAVDANIVKMAARSAYLEELLEMARGGEEKAQHHVQSVTKINTEGLKWFCVAHDVKTLLINNPHRSFNNSQLRDVLGASTKYQKKHGKDLHKTISSAMNNLRKHARVFSAKANNRIHLRWDSMPEIGA